MATRKQASKERRPPVKKATKKKAPVKKTAKPAAAIKVKTQHLYEVIFDKPRNKLVFKNTSNPVYNGYHTMKYHCGSSFTFMKKNDLHDLAQAILDYDLKKLPKKVIKKGSVVTSKGGGVQFTLSSGHIFNLVYKTSSRVRLSSPHGTQEFTHKEITELCEALVKTF